MPREPREKYASLEGYGRLVDYVETVSGADRVTVAHLRMSLDAVRALKAAIEGIELLAAPAAGGQRN